MEDFGSVYKQLNAEQRQAVDAIEGPLLVIAGPGTGKTQLLSARVANILTQTDTLPQNILCLTFTESGAKNMRERLTRFIGQDAYNVTISTYHGLGSDIIRRFPEYFTATRLQNPVDQLGKHQILTNIIKELSYQNPLKQLQHHIGDLISTISELKRALLSAEDLRTIAGQNLAFIQSANATLAQPLSELSAQSRMSKASIPLFEQFNAYLVSIPENSNAHATYSDLAPIAQRALAQALEQANETGKSTALTAWKNAWLAKDAENNYVFDGNLANRRILALADVFESYQTALAHQALYDFDDMIARSIEALEQHPELKYTLQERYLYILLDEFQDTNAAQLRLVELLADNPVHEGRPNIMAVGDDDQAIYAFQGAQYSNMIDFYRLFRDVGIINLTQNYRSHADIVSTSANVADQITARLHSQLTGVSKQLVAANTSRKNSRIVRQELSNDVSQYHWIANQIQDLIIRGTPHNEIAVLAPKHRYLEPLVAHLAARNIPVQYEKRENILEAPIIRQLLTMCRLVLSLAKQDQKQADSLWPEVLSYPFWGIPTQEIWRLSWSVNDAGRDADTSWLRTMLESSTHQTPALLFATAALRTQTDSCETLLDYLIGTQSIATNDPELTHITSPLRKYYTDPAFQQEQPELFYETMSELKVLQSKLREHQTTSGRLLLLEDLLSFVKMYEEANEMLLNTSPHHQHANAVQLMTVFKAKGLEFEHVFLPSCHDDVWGTSSRGSRNNLTLPENLSPIRHAGATDDERLRILYVAMTRAKQGLWLTSFTHTYTGKPTKRLKYMGEYQLPDNTFQTTIFPPEYQKVISDDTEAPLLETLEASWHDHHLVALADTSLQDILSPRLKKYQLSPTHLNQFVDLIHGGPQEFVLKTLLRFPQAPTAAGQYGNAIHETLEWAQHRTAESSKPPTTASAIDYFRHRMQSKSLTESERVALIDRGEHALRAWLPAKRDMWLKPTKAEHDFRSEGVFVGNAHLTGKIDLMEIDKSTKTITVIDYKTGSIKPKWVNTDPTLHKYRQQLYCYKILIEGSHSYAGYTVSEARLEFIEPDTEGNVHSLSLTFDPQELQQTKQLIKAIWSHIQSLTFPDTSSYSKDQKGITSFESDIIQT